MTSSIDIPDLRPGRRRRFTREEKMAILTEAVHTQQSLSSVGRRYGIAVSLLFRWKKDLGFDVAASPSPSVSRQNEGTSLEGILRAMHALEAEVNWLCRQNRRLQERFAQLESSSTFEPSPRAGQATRASSMG